MTQGTPSPEPAIAIAVLYERINHVIEKVDALAKKIDAQDQRRTAALEELETRVESIENKVNGVRWFLAGIAAAGGALGGSVATGLARMLG